MVLTLHSLAAPICPRRLLHHAMFILIPRILRRRRNHNFLGDYALRAPATTIPQCDRLHKELQCLPAIPVHIFNFHQGHAS